MDDIIKCVCLVLGLCCTVYLAECQTKESSIVTVYEWKQMEFAFESNERRKHAIRSGEFIPNATLPIDVVVYYVNNNINNRKIFVSMPRMTKGIPATFGVISKNKYNGENVIEPYPSWEWHRNPEACNRNRLYSVFRAKIDKCKRLWVLDTGDGNNCPPQILAFDLKTDKVLVRFTIPSHLYESRSVLVTPVVDVRDAKCTDTFIYIADCQTYSIIVYDVKNNNAWKITDKTFYPNPTAGTFDIQGQQYDYMDGVMGMALSPFDSNNPNKDRTLFYQALSSLTINWVLTSHLRNQSMFKEGPLSTPQIFHTYSTQKPSQSAPMAIHNTHIAYFGLATQTSISCWNTTEDYGTETDTIYQNSTTMQFASGIKVLTNPLNIDELWILTDRFQQQVTGTRNPNEINFRLSTGNTSTLLENTKCVSKK